MMNCFYPYIDQE